MLLGPGTINYSICNGCITSRIPIPVLQGREQSIPDFQIILILPELQESVIPWPDGLPFLFSHQIVKCWCYLSLNYALIFSLH